GPTEGRSGPETALLPSSAYHALLQLCKGSDATSRTLHQEMSTRLDHLAFRLHDPVEVNGGHSVTKDPLCILVQTHSANHTKDPLCILDHTIVCLLDGWPLTEFGIAPVGRVQVKWSPHSSADGLGSYLQAGDPKAFFLPEGKRIRDSGEVAMEVEDMNLTSCNFMMVNVDGNEVDPDQNTSIYLFLTATSRTQKPRVMGLLLMNGVGIVHGNIHGLMPLHHTAAKRHYKPLQHCDAVMTGSVSYVKLPPQYFEMYAELQNQRNHGPIHMAAFHGMCFNLHMASFHDTSLNPNSTSMIPWDSTPLQKNQVLNKESGNWLLDDELDDFHESFWRSVACGRYWRLASKNGSATVVNINSQYALKQDSKFLYQNLKAIEGLFAALVMLRLDTEENMLAAAGMLVEGIRTERSMHNTVVDEALSMDDASIFYYNNGRMMALVCKIKLLDHCGMASWIDHYIGWRSLFLLVKAAKVGDTNITKLLMVDVDVNDSVPQGNLTLNRLLGGTSSTWEPRTVLLQLKNGAKIFHGRIHGVPPACGSEFFSAKLGHVDEAMVSGNQMQPRGFGFLKLERDEGVALTKDHMLRKRLDLKDSAARASLLVDSKGTTTPVTLERELAHTMVPARIGAETHMIHLSLCSKPKVELSESKSDYRYPASPLTGDFIGDNERQQVSSCNESNVKSLHGDMGRMSNTNSQQDDDSTDGLLIPIFVRHISGELTFAVNLGQPSQHLMQWYAEKTNTKLQSQYFIYGRKRIEPHRDLMFYGVQRDTTIHVCVGLLGGANDTVETYVNIHKGEFLTEVILPDGRVSLKMTKAGCLFLSTWLKCFTRTFSRSKSWNGRFNLSDFKVSGGHVLVINEAEVELDMKSLQADLKVLVEFIKAIFCKNGSNLISKYPPYLENLTKFLESLKTSRLSEHDRFFIETHLCCVESAARGFLLVILRKKYKSLLRGQQIEWDRAVQREDYTHTVFPALDNLSKVAVFQEIIEAAKERAEAYTERKTSKFRLMRDEFVHAPSKRFDKSVDPWKEKFKNDDGIELLIPAQYEGVLCDIMYNLIMTDKVDISAEYVS
ncbi:hypothetical protein EJB05_25578, partial [Eragrostis curvula]